MTECQQPTSGLASCGVYARGKFCGNLKVCRPCELLCSPPERQAANRCMSCRQTENTNFCDYENYMNTDNSKYYSLTLTLLGVFLVYFCYEVDLPEFLYFKWLRSIILFLSLPSFLLSLFYIRQSIKKKKSIDRYIILIITSICLFCSLVLHMWFLTLFILWGGNESSLASL